MLKIGDFSRIAQVSIRLLHYYDQIGLLSPLRVDRLTGYRYYSVEQLPRLYRILALKDLGLSLDEITYLLDEAVTNDEIRGILLLKRAELKQRVIEAQARLARVESRLSWLEPIADVPQAEIVLKHVEAQTVISTRRALQRGESPKGLIRDGIAALREHQLWRHVQSFSCIYHSGYIAHRYPAIQPKRQLAEAAFVIDPAKVSSPPRVGRQRMNIYQTPRFHQVATAIHSGADSGRHLTFQAMWRWLREQKLCLAAPPREIYLRRGTVDHPEDNITEVQFPLAMAEFDRVE